MGEAKWINILHLVKAFEQNTKVFMENQDDVISKLVKIVEDGKSKLQVIADFDWTLTKSNVDGVPTMHCYEMFALLPMLNQNYQDKINKFLHKYVQLLSEADNDIEKHLISKQWFNDHEELIIGLNISREALQETVGKADVPLRDGCAAYIETLVLNSIPFTVVSSGIGDVIEIHLKKQGIEIINTVANFLRIQNGIVQGFKEPFVSTYNKDLISLPIEDRPNIILIGDALEDHKMGDSIPSKQTVLKIGYCPEVGKVPNYQKHFDIVLVNDQTMDIAKAVTSLLITNTSELTNED